MGVSGYGEKAGYGGVDSMAKWPNSAPRTSEQPSSRRSKTLDKIQFGLDTRNVWRWNALLISF